MLVGRPKTGKTTFCASWPDTVWINTDKGLSTVKKLGLSRPFITITRMTPESKNNPDEMNSWLNVRDILLQIKYGEGPIIDRIKKLKMKIGTVVIDGLSALSDILECELVLKPPRGDDDADGEGGSALTLPMYNIVQRRVYELIDIGRELPCHFLCTALVDLDEDDEGRTIENPALTGRKLGLKVPGLFNEVFMSYTEGGVSSPLEKADPVSYWISSLPMPRARYLGNRIFEVKAPVENPSFEKLSKTIKGGK